MKKVLISIDEEQHEKVLAKINKDHRGESFSSIVRGLLRQWLKK